MPKGQSLSQGSGCAANPVLTPNPGLLHCSPSRPDRGPASRQGTPEEKQPVRWRDPPAPPLGPFPAGHPWSPGSQHLIHRWAPRAQGREGAWWRVPAGGGRPGAAAHRPHPSLPTPLPASLSPPASLCPHPGSPHTHARTLFTRILEPAEQKLSGSRARLRRQPLAPTLVSHSSLRSQ